MITSLNHEINNPLAILSGYLEIIADEPEQVKEYSEKMKSTLDRISKLIEKISKIGDVEFEEYTDDATQMLDIE